MDNKQSKIQRAWQHYDIGMENRERGIECRQRSDNDKANEYFQMSINEFSAMLKILPRDQKAAISGAHVRIGLVYEHVSRFQQAEDHYNLALKADPNNVHAKNVLQRFRAWQHKNNLQQLRRFLAQQRQQSLHAELQRGIDESNAIYDIMKGPGGPLGPWQPRPPF
jgi:tetratricopeptide (TPR) repeat protein